MAPLTFEQQTGTSAHKLTHFLELFIVKILPVFAFVLAIAFYLQTYDSCQIKITLAYMGSTLFVSLWMIKFFEQNKPLSLVRDYNTLLLPVVLFLVSGIVSYSVSPFKSTSLEEILKRILFISMFFVVASEFGKKERVESLLRWIMVGALVSSLYGLIQYFQLDPFLWKNAFGKRIFSTFGNPNFFAAYLVWVAPILLAYFLLTRSWVYLFTFVISAFCVIHTQSKASWIGLTMGVVVFALLSIRFLSHAKKQHIKRLMIVGTILTVVASGFGVYVLSKKRIDSLRFRVFTWEATWKMIRQPMFVSPLQSQTIGTGIGTFKIVYPAYRMPQIFHIEGKHNTETDHPEDEFIEIWYDEGIIGISIFLWLLATLYWFGFSKARHLSLSLQRVATKSMNAQQHSQYALQHYLVGVMAGLAGLLTHNFMCVNMRFVSSGFFLWILFALLIAIVRAMQEISDGKIDGAAMGDSKPTHIPRWLKRVFEVCVVLMATLLFIYGVRGFKADLYHNRGIAYSKARMWDKAIEAYTRVIKNNPGFVMTHYFMGNVFNDRWDMNKLYNSKWGDKNNIPRTDAERTLAKYDDVRKLAPNYVQVHYQTGVVYVKLHQWDEALKWFEKYHKLDPVFPENYFQMGWIYMQQKKWDKSEAMFKQAIENNPNFGEAYINLGNMYYTKGDKVLAEKTYREALQKNPDLQLAYRNLAVIYLERNDKQHLIEMTQQLLRLDPNDKNAQQLLQQMQNA